MPENLFRRDLVNHLLASLSPADFSLLEPHLEVVDLPVRKQLQTHHRRIDHVYFIEHGIASVVTRNSGKQGIEVGIIGREGVTGLAVIMETDRSPNDTFMQMAGDGRRIKTGRLRESIEQSATLRRTLLRYGHSFVIQTAHTALANGRNKLEERLARWLLMAHDRVDGDDIHLTHEFLSIMLGVRREGITVSLNQWTRAGLVETKRGVITILDRAGLEEISNGSYGAPEAELRRLFG
jgi:CRP-like cAMP-binding protein